MTSVSTVHDEPAATPHAKPASYLDARGLGSGLFTLVFFGGIGLWLATGSLPVLIIVAILFLLGAAKSFIRWRAITVPLAAYKSKLNRDLWVHVFLWPFASLLYFYNTIVAAFSRRIKWRGITYELKSPSEAVIISREPA